MKAVGRHEMKNVFLAFTGFLSLSSPFFIRKLNEISRPQITVSFNFQLKYE